jgi:hypothetical protein
MMSNSKERHSRLGWVELHILLALGDADLHGYAIMQKVAHDTSGRIRNPVWGHQAAHGGASHRHCASAQNH